MTSASEPDNDRICTMVEPLDTPLHGNKPSVLVDTLSDAGLQPPVGTLLPSNGISDAGMFEEDQTLISKICSKIEQLSESDRLRSQLVVLYSDTLCPILKFHTELFAEIVRVLSSIFAGHPPSTQQSPLQDISQASDHSWSTPSHPNILAIVVSPSSDTHVKVMLAEPFQLDLTDRVRLADIQVENTPLPLRDVLVVDDSWARLKAKNDLTVVWRSAEAAREHHVLSLSHECSRLSSLLACVSASSRKPIGPLQVLCVVDQSESERYGVPAGISGKVIFIVTKDREERPKSVALKTCMHWIDRMFLKSGYTLEWIHANVIPLYVGLPGSPRLSLKGQREDSVFAGVGIQLSAKRPLEACTRIKVREGDGAEVLESNVLEEVERSKLFETHAIHGPRFEELMGNMSLVGDTLVGNPRAPDRGDGTNGDDTEDDNPFL